MHSEKRNKILQTALRLFTEHGFRGTSTAEISKQAGVATGTLFHHFKNKEELIEEIYLAAKTELAEVMQAATVSAQGTDEALKLLWFAFAEWSIQNEEKYRFFKHCEATPYISDSIREKGAAQFLFVMQYFAELAARKGGTVSEAMLLDLFAGASDGFIRHLINNPEVKADKSQWETVFEMFWKMFS
jgi:AcrR family transcriptional regulator